jgi:hypothetical protein
LVGGSAKAVLDSVIVVTTTRADRTSAARFLVSIAVLLLADECRNVVDA